MSDCGGTCAASPSAWPSRACSSCPSTGTPGPLLLFDEMVARARAKGFQWLDLSLTSEDNPRTPVLAERMGATLYKRYRTYRLSL